MSERLKKFYAEVHAKLGGLRQAEWIAANPGKHLWVTWPPYESCAHCGTMRRADDKNKPCKGIVKVTFRKVALRSRRSDGG